MVKSFSGLIICLHTKRKKLMFLSSYTTLEIGKCYKLLLLPRTNTLSSNAYYRVPLITAMTTKSIDSATY